MAFSHAEGAFIFKMSLKRMDGSGMAKYYQVNQAYSNNVEFKKEYLCAPDQEIEHWEILKDLQVDDILFHYSSLDKRVFGRSRVVELGHHKGAEGAKILEETSTFRIYEGDHLSLKHMSTEAKAAEADRENRYIEVHTKIIEVKYLGLNFFEGKRVYCIRIDTPLAEKRLGKGVSKTEAPKVIVKRGPR